MSIFQVEGEDAKIVEFTNVLMAPFFRMMTHFFYVGLEDRSFEWIEELGA